MKKFFYLFLALALCASITLSLASCTEEEAKEIFENLSEEEWEQALSAPNFENVTIHYEYTQGNVFTKQTAKFTKTGVYRSVEMTSIATGEPAESMAQYFEGEEADQQRNLFLKTFLAIVEDRDNFVYDESTKLYTAENAEARIDHHENAYVTEKIKDGKLSFNSDGNVEKFMCNLTESIYMENELKETHTFDVTWTFSDYGTTEITAAEKASKG